MAVAEHAVSCVCTAPSHAVQTPGHAAVCTPAAEYVPAAHATTTASADAEHGAVMRWPGPAVEHGERVASFVAVHCAKT